MKVPIWKIWLSDKPLPEHFKQYTDTWDKISGGEVKDVNMGNLRDYGFNYFDVDRLMKKFDGSYTVFNHYMRYWLMFTYGGIYLDLDVEVLKKSELWYSKYPVFFEESNNWVNNHIMICNRKSFDVFYYLLWATEVVYPLIEKKEINTGPGLVTSVLGMFKNIKIMPPEYTTPWNWNEKPDRSRITENTIAVHHFAHSWKK